MSYAIQEAEKLIQEQRHGEAINLLTEVLNREGPTARTLINRATAFIGVNEQRRAVQDLQDASQRNPNPEEENRIDEVIKSLSHHVVNNLDTTSSRALGDTQDRDLQSSLINGLLSGGFGGGQSSQFSKLGLLASILGSGRNNNSGSSGQFSLGQIVPLLVGTSGGSSTGGGAGSAFSALLSSFSGSSQGGYNNGNGSQTHGGQHSNYGGQQSNYGGQHSNYGGQQSNYGGQQSNYGAHSNDTGFSQIISEFTNSGSNYGGQGNQGGYGSQVQSGYSQQSSGGLGSFISELTAGVQGHSQGGYNEGGFNRQGGHHQQQGYGRPTEFDDTSNGNFGQGFGRNDQGFGGNGYGGKY